MAAKRYLTKSRFKLGRECPTKLFYTGKKDRYDDQSLDDSFLQALASGGFQVGELAKIYHPGGVMIDSLDYDEACEKTDELLKLEDVTIYEAAFRCDSLFVRVDVLVKKGNQIQLIEVKSKSFDPTEDDQFFDKQALKRGIRKIRAAWIPYLEDIAFQTYVAAKNWPEFLFAPYLMVADKSKLASVDGLNQRFLLTLDERGRQRVTVKDGTDLKEVGEQILCRLAVSEEVNLILGGDGDTPFDETVKRLTQFYVSDAKAPAEIGTQCKTCQFRSDDHKRSGFHECWQEAAGLKGEDLKGPFVFDVWNFRKASSLIES